MTSEGIVYVLTNPAIPGMVKIGKTSRGMNARLNELYSTGVPLPFECAYAARTGHRPAAADGDRGRNAVDSERSRQC